MRSLAAFDVRRPAPLAPLAAPAWERSVEQLPIPLTSFVGRETETATIHDLLLRTDVRLLTLTGPGGVGKTRLALRILPELRPSFPGGVWFVELASISDASLVLATVASVLGARSPDGRPFTRVLATAIGDVPTLVAFDNLEQVADAASDIAELLAACPALTILVTSRVSLRLGGERLFPVAPLSVGADVADDFRHGDPSVPGNPILAAAQAPSPAVTLFAQRARSVRPDFSMTDANIVAVTEICRGLDGLPLAIELAAARTRVLSPAALLLRLDNKLSVLTGGPRDLPSRQRTLRDTIAWSYDLLPPDQQTLLQFLSVFVGGFTLETAETIVTPSVHEPPSNASLTLDVDAVLDDLSDLVDGGLIRREEQSGGETRFRLPETVREYGLERLRAAGQEDAIRSRHATLITALASKADLNEYRAGEIVSLIRIGEDLDNIRAALTWSLRPGASRSDIDIALTLSGETERFFLTRGHIVEGRLWIERALARGDDASDDARALALGALGIMTFSQQDGVRSKSVLEESLALWHKLDRPVDEARSLFFLGLLATVRRDVPGLREAIDRVTPLTPRISASTWRNTKITLESLHARITGDLDMASRLLEQSFAAYTKHGFAWGTAWLQGIMASVAFDRGDLLGSLALRQASLRAFRDHGDVASVGSILIDIALLATRVGQPEAAARFLGIAIRIKESTGLLISGDALQDNQAREETLAALGPETFAANEAAGRLLATSVGVAHALSLSATPTPMESSVSASPAALGRDFGLTPRELEILQTLADGRTTNRELADALSISPKTAGNHIDNILAKMGVHSRVAAVALADREQLVS